MRHCSSTLDTFRGYRGSRILGNRLSIHFDDHCDGGALVGLHSGLNFGGKSMCENQARQTAHRRAKGDGVMEASYA